MKTSSTLGIIADLTELRDYCQFTRNTRTKGDPAIPNLQIRSNEINARIQELEKCQNR